MKNSRKQKEKKGEVKTEKKEKMPKAYRYVDYIKFNRVSFSLVGVFILFFYCYCICFLFLLFKIL